MERYIKEGPGVLPAFAGFILQGFALRGFILYGETIIEQSGKRDSRRGLHSNESLSSLFAGQVA
jgi:hypothetical protein